MMRELTTWSPFQSLSSFRRDMDELFSRFFGDWERGGAAWAPLSAGYSPQIESYVDGNTLLIRADLPGVEPKDVEITVEGNQLTLKGERKVSQEQKEHQEGAHCLHSEVRYGSFVRTFALPEGVKADAVQARYHNGVLEVSIPLPAAMATKKVPIQIQGEGRKQLAA
jgi:HSP20 family protein